MQKKKTPFTILIKFCGFLKNNNDQTSNILIQRHRHALCAVKQTLHQSHDERISISLWAEHFEPTPTTNWCKRPENIITTNVLQSRIMITLQQYQYQQQQQHQLHFTAQPQQRFNKLNGKLSSYMWFASFFFCFFTKIKWFLLTLEVLLGGDISIISLGPSLSERSQIASIIDWTE